jgi:hypothetical protein
MIPHIPDQRKTKAPGGAFGQLVKYITQEGKTISRVPEQKPGVAALPKFADLLDYATAPESQGNGGEKCIAVRTHGVRSLATAALEMDAVAQKNRRVENPAYHIILSWPEHEHPVPEKIFDAAEHALKALGLHEHQYVLAVHGDTDNTHCHISVNRVHPITFKSNHIEWATKTLHLAARQSEIKHGWTHDNGIYVVQVDGHGKKSIILNKDLAQSVGADKPRVHKEFGTEPVLPTWHDPEGLDSWLKKSVARALKNALPKLDGWPAMHAWLDRYDIRLTDAGGGFRLHVTSPETGEVLDIAASKGLRILKRADLEQRWGKFAAGVQIDARIPDLSHLSPQQLQKGIEHVLTSSPDGGRPPEFIRQRNAADELVVRPEHHSERDAADSSRSLYELPNGPVAGDGHASDGVLPRSLQDGVGDDKPGQNTDLRRAGDGEVGGGGQGVRSRVRDQVAREVRKEQRALSRLDLRQRFAQYKRFVVVGDTEHFIRLKEAKDERREAIKATQDARKAAKAALRQEPALDRRLVGLIAIDAECERLKAIANLAFESKQSSLRATRTPPLSWRSWLHEQANLGDQAALSALRGIVYQAQRDAKKDALLEPEQVDELVVEPASNEYRELQFRKVMDRLLKAEKDDIAIRSANAANARPHESDALIANYRQLQMRVTGNGNVEYSHLSGKHSFTDRGNRLTFDRVQVSDEDIRLALAHARSKFGHQLTLTGDNVDFAERMACLADDMGIEVLNPELASVINAHRESRNHMAVADIDPPAPTSIDAQHEPETPTHDTALRSKVLAIDPKAKIVMADTLRADAYYVGQVAAEADGIGFAQHTGRSTYVIHLIKPPAHAAGDSISVRYRQGAGAAIVVPQTRDRAENIVKPKVTPELSPAPQISETVPESSLKQTESPVSAHAWMSELSRNTGMPIVAPAPEAGNVAYIVLYVSTDGIVVDKGRTLTLYPVDALQNLRAGDAVTVSPDALLRRATARQVGNDKGER